MVKSSLSIKHLNELLTYLDISHKSSVHYITPNFKYFLLSSIPLLCTEIYALLLYISLYSKNTHFKPLTCLWQYIQVFAFFSQETIIYYYRIFSHSQMLCTRHFCFNGGFSFFIFQWIKKHSSEKVDYLDYCMPFTLTFN